MPGGAPEHIAARSAPQAPTWEGAVAFSNLGLPGQAMRGQDRQKHLKRTTKLVTELFEVTQ